MIQDETSMSPQDSYRSTRTFRGFSTDSDDTPGSTPTNLIGESLRSGTVIIKDELLPHYGLGTLGRRPSESKEAVSERRPSGRRPSALLGKELLIKLL